MNSLFKLPDVVLKNIMEYPGILSILTLRKVSRGFRNFIDGIVPQVDLHRMDIFLDSDHVFYQIWINDSEIIGFRYKKVDEDCLVTGGDDEKKLPVDTEYLDRFLNNFKIVLNHQKLFEELYFYVDEDVNQETNNFIFKGLKKTIGNEQIKVEQLYLRVINPEDVLFVFPHVSPQFLKTIHIFISTFTMKLLDLTEIAKMDQWKNADNVSFQNIIVTSKVEDFTHFCQITVAFETLHAEDLVVFRKAAMKNPKFEVFQILYRNFDDLGNVVSLMGSSSFIPLDSTENEEEHWFYKIPNNQNILKIELSKPDKCIQYSRTDRESIPTGATILD